MDTQAQKRTTKKPSIDWAHFDQHSSEELAQLQLYILELEEEVRQHREKKAHAPWLGGIPEDELEVVSEQRTWRGELKHNGFAIPFTVMSWNDISQESSGQWSLTISILLEHLSAAGLDPAKEEADRDYLIERFDLKAFNGGPGAPFGRAAFGCTGKEDAAYYHLHQGGGLDI